MNIQWRNILCGDTLTSFCYRIFELGYDQEYALHSIFYLIDISGYENKFLLKERARVGVISRFSEYSTLKKIGSVIN